MDPKEFGYTVSTSFKNILTDAVNGRFPIRISRNILDKSNLMESNLFGDGVDILLGQDKILATEPKERNVSVLSPRASILIKKKAFSNFKSNNDIQWLDRTEKMLLRATKALFAYKVTQIRAYESLSKIEDFFQKSSEINLNLLVELYHNAQFLTADPVNFVNENQPGIVRLFQRLASYTSNTIREYNYEGIKQDILLLLERNAFASDLSLTTWIVDPNDPDNYGTGPGTGVIELGTYSDFSTNVNLNTDPSSASITLQDPYRVMYITEGDIEIAIEEAVTGTIGILKNLGSTPSPVDTKSVVSAGLEILGLGGFESEINLNYVRDRLRVFYLGRPIINPGDGVNFFIRGNKTSQFFSKQYKSFDRSLLSIDESILEAERILFTNKKIDFETYKELRQFSDNSFGMRHVYGGFITQTSESWSNGGWTIKVDCTDNMAWLKWSRFMDQPATQDPQGILEDPFTPYEIKKDSLGRVLVSGGPDLLEENKYLIRNGLLTYDSGILNGQYATETNLLQGQYNQSGSISGTKILQHPHGLVYRWKEGVFSATTATTVVDPLREDLVTQKIHNQKYGLGVTENVLNNLDIANILSILIVGQPYNVETFIDQAYKAMNIRSRSADLNPEDPLSGVIEVLRKQNSNFGNFRPYRMLTLSSETLLQSATNSVQRTETNQRIKQLRTRLNELEIIIDRLQQERRGRSANGALQIIPSVSTQNDLIIRNLQAERESILAGIQSQLGTLSGSGAISSKDLLTQNFNLFGRSKVLPLTGNYTGDHQLTRAMVLLGAQRRIEDVRLNRDKNLFIVSDQYDEQSDIRPFLFKLRDSNYKIFKGNFVYTYDKCEEAASILNLEFFCNTQGHLEFRPPQWNRTPLSILERLFEISRNTSKKIVPDFLTETFQSRTSSLRREIHTYNIKIVLLCLLLNRYPDRNLIPNFSAGITVPTLSGKDDIPADLKIGKASLKFFGVNILGLDDDQGPILEVSSTNKVLDTQRIAQRLRIRPLERINVKLAYKLGPEGDVINGDTDTLLGVFDPIFQESSNLVNNLLTVATNTGGVTPLAIANTENLNELRESFIKETGIDPAAGIIAKEAKFQDTDFIFYSNAENPEVDNIGKTTKYLKKLEQAISSRDSLVTILKRNKEKQDELAELEGILSGEFTAQNNNFLEQLAGAADRVSNTAKTITDIFTGDANKGSLFDHLIEDDRRNLLGPGSGKRYVIEDVDIISCTFVENPPDYCRIDFVGDAPVVADALRAPFEDTYYWAGATDFDLWRQYGYKHGGYKTIAFSNDAELVSKPYAITDLQLQRLKINQANVTVVGNEYYEPGDVVYLKTKQLLYYVRSVDHNFDWGGSYTTSLTLEFGHPPGTYLPSPLDIIGQQFTKSPLEHGGNTTYRNINGDDNYRVLQPDCSIVFPPNFVYAGDESTVELLSYKDNAVRLTNIMIELSSLTLGAKDRLVLIRGFVIGNSPEEEQKVTSYIYAVKDLIQNPVMLSKESTSLYEDIAAFRNNPRAGLGTQVGNKKSLTPMFLPNGLPVTSIPFGQIAEQITFINKEEGNTNRVLTFNPVVVTKQTVAGKEVTVNDFLSAFPKGGPKQRTWLDIKDVGNLIGLQKVDPSELKFSNVIEIGILDVNRAVETVIRSQQ